MLTWISVALAVTGSLTTVLVKIRAHLLAWYLWHKPRDLKVLREVSRFERRLRDPFVCRPQAGDEVASHDHRAQVRHKREPQAVTSAVRRWQRTCWSPSPSPD